ncbi:MAG TPA: glycosyltransferase [Pyrinomonadaceae bacterium]|nr:glycosyltransferase [Pyrinomonadaceae bacterium]
MIISVVVPVRNEEDSISALLEALLTQTLPPNEIVIVDGGSSDRTADIINTYASNHSQIHLIREANALPGKGRNVGATFASNAWLAFTDAGVVPAEDWLAQLADAALHDPASDVVYGCWEPVTDSFFKECAAIAYAKVPTKAVDKRFIESRAVFSSLMRRSVWQAVNGFPENLRSAEDILFMKRIDDAGFHVAYAPHAVVRWTMQPTWWRTFRRFVTYSRHNMRAGLWRQWQAAALARYAALLVCALVLIMLTRWWPIVVAMLLLIMMLARAIAALWRSRDVYPSTILGSVSRVVMLVPMLTMIDVAMFLGVLAWLVKDSWADKEAPV